MSLSPIAPGAWADAAACSREAAWRDRLVAMADDIVAHRLTFLGLTRQYLDDPIDWNRDHEAGTPSPRRFADSIDYRDASVAGDAKLVWEPARHLQLVVLARAYRATGRPEYVEAALAQVASFLDQCPFGVGMQWRSPLELAIRAINWCWFLSLAEPSGLITGSRRARLLHALDLHVFDITRKYSRGSSANNHRIGEAAGVFIATTVIPSLTRAEARRHEARAILIEEIDAQHHPDGGNTEQAFGYHLFVLQFLLLSAVAARRAGDPMPAGYLARLRTIVDFAAALLEAGPAPMYGDADDGYVVDLGGRETGGREIVALGRAVLGERTGDEDERVDEPAQWIFGPADFRKTASVITSRALPDTGIYLLQWGAAGRADAASLTFDCGELGQGAIAAHGHADALAVTLRAFGSDILVDPGTFDYFRHPEWREYLRSTRAHNTIVIDDTDQSVMLGPFMWGARARATCLEWTAADGMARVVGEHDGYARLADPVRHRRTVAMDAGERTFHIEDTIEASAEHRVLLPFHCGEHVELVELPGQRSFLLTVAGGRVELSIDPAVAVTVVRGTDASMAGWVSRGYHQKTRSVSLLGSARVRGSLRLRTRLRLIPGAPQG